jgi:hypothetical protein
MIAVLEKRRFTVDEFVRPVGAPPDIPGAVSVSDLLMPLDKGPTQESHG